jgi:CubicO group peptidase (beta-lactamase class C family)
MNRKRTVLAMCVLVCWARPIFGQSQPKPKQPDAVGFSSERLARLTTFFQGAVDKGAIPGVTLLVARDGKQVYLQALGYQDREKSIPMKPDAIFRIASMTKPITSVAVMMLAEEGKSTSSLRCLNTFPSLKTLRLESRRLTPARASQLFPLRIRSAR